MLHYNYIFNHLNWHWKKDNHICRIFIDGIKDDFLGEKQSLSEDDLHGISFYCPDPHVTEIYLHDRRIRNVIKNPPDFLGQRSISFPMRRRESFERY